MAPEEIEDMLYDRAIRTKIRPPVSERLANLGYNRMVRTGIAAVAALVCTLAMIKSPATDSGNTSPTRSQITGTEPKKHEPTFQAQPDNSNPITASLAMSRITN